MTVTIPPEFAEFVDGELASGRFQSTDELLAAALSLLRERERRWGLLQSEIQEGLDDVEAGRVSEFDAEDFIARAEKRRAEGRVS